jgi:hypothetical protein
VGRIKKFISSIIADLRGLDLRFVVVLTTAAALLAVRHFYFNAGFFKRHIAAIPAKTLPLDDITRMFPQLWWAVGCIFLYLIVAGLVAKFVLKIRLRDCGITLKGLPGSLPVVILLYFLMLPILVYVASDPAFTSSYPFPGRIVCGTALGFLVWEAVYGAQFFALEFFFRGFMLFPLKKKLGYNAIFVMMVPYAMIHFTKPAPEAFGSIIAGFALGYLALRTGSIIGCFLLHWGVAVTMDVLSLINQESFFLVN